MFRGNLTTVSNSGREVAAKIHGGDPEPEGAVLRKPQQKLSRKGRVTILKQAGLQRRAHVPDLRGAPRLATLLPSLAETTEPIPEPRTIAEYIVAA
jgi:hypothetical protein